MYECGRYVLYDTGRQSSFFKESREGILIMCKVMEDMRKESLQEGVKEGIKEGAINTSEAFI
jgi:hypothetical protein